MRPPLAASRVPLQVSDEMVLALDALITWYDDLAEDHAPAEVRLRDAVGQLFRAGPHPNSAAAADINLLVSHGPHHLNTQPLLAIERLRHLNQTGSSNGSDDEPLT